MPAILNFRLFWHILLRLNRLLDLIPNYDRRQPNKKIIGMPRVLRSSQNLLLGLSTIWFLLFVYFEKVVPVTQARHCNWEIKNDQTNVLLVADPQLIDNHTYPGRPEPLLALSKHTVDIYLKQNYKAIVNHLKPDYIFFLGDYLDNGRLSLDTYFASEFNRFEQIFNRWSQYRRGENWFTEVPGNHDEGFGAGVKPILRDRFNRYFGTPNIRRFIDGVEFISIDAPSLLAAAPVSDPARNFVDSLGEPTQPRILLSHVPLRRDTVARPCGPLRESPAFHQNAGYQYQLALDQLITDELLQKVKPELIFSGDDHDYCDIRHPTNAREITVKSISMAMGIKHPAVQLLLFKKVNAGALDLEYDTHMCYLPTPYVNIAVYVVMAVISGFALLVSCFMQRSGRYNYLTLLVWESETHAAVIKEAPVPVSQKVSRFLRDQDHDQLVVQLTPIPVYMANTESWLGRKLRRWTLRLRLLIRRFNLVSMMRHFVISGAVAIILYLLVIWTI